MATHGVKSKRGPKDFPCSEVFAADSRLPPNWQPRRWLFYTQSSLKHFRCRDAMIGIRCLLVRTRSRILSDHRIPLLCGSARTLTSTTQPSTPSVHFRQQLRDEARKARIPASGRSKASVGPDLANWELTVGLEIHAQLNTQHKLFSSQSPQALRPYLTYLRGQNLCRIESQFTRRILRRCLTW